MVTHYTERCTIRIGITQNFCLRYARRRLTGNGDEEEGRGEGEDRDQEPKEGEEGTEVYHGGSGELWVIFISWCLYSAVAIPVGWKG